MKRTTILSILVWLAIGLTSCDNSPELDPRIGTCDEPVEINAGLEVMIIETTEGRMLLSDTLGIMHPCDQVDFNFSLPTEGTWITITGGRGTAMNVDFMPPNRTLFPMISEKINIKTDPYVPQGVNIEIYPVDNQYGQGFGYFIEYKNTRIRQDEVPGVAGLEPFTTERQATKIALYVTYLLRSDNDFPSVYEPDLNFMLIDY